MSLSYKLADFSIVENEDTNIYERIVSVDLCEIKELPIIIVERLESLINRTIEEYEQKHNMTISMENAELNIFMDVDTQEHTLSLNAYVGYDVKKEYIVGKEVVTVADADYDSIRKFFFNKLSDYVVEQIRRIEECVW